MFIAHVPEELPTGGAHVPRSEAKYFAPPELLNSLGSGIYKYLVPPGPQN